MKFPCPKCGKKFKRTQGLGIHMRTHGILGGSKSAINRRLAIMEEKTHERKPEVGNGFHSEIAYAAGYIGCWVENFAHTIGIPPASVAERVAESLLGETRRTKLGS